MKELIAEHTNGFKVRTLIESGIISETISDLRLKGFQSFVIKSVSNVNPGDYNWKEVGQWLSAN